MVPSPRLTRQQREQIEQMTWNQRAVATAPLAALAVLNRRHDFMSTEIKATARLVGGKRVATPRHLYIDLKVDDMPEVRRALGPLGFIRKSPEAHEVRETWVHYHVDDACEHVWPLEPQIAGRFYCGRCDGFRVRRRAHVRGGSPGGPPPEPKPYLVRP